MRVHHGEHFQRPHASQLRASTHFVFGTVLRGVFLGQQIHGPLVFHHSLCYLLRRKHSKRKFLSFSPAVHRDQNDTQYKGITGAEQALLHGRTDERKAGEVLCVRRCAGLQAAPTSSLMSRGIHAVSLAGNQGIVYQELLIRAA